MAQLFDEIKNSNKLYDIEKFNPYHDKLGRFSTSGGAASFTYKPGKGKMYDNAIEREKERTSKMDDGAKTTPKQATNEEPKKPSDPHSFDKDYVRNEVERLKQASQEEKNSFLVNHYTSEDEVKEFERYGDTDNLLDFIAECAERSSIPDDVEKKDQQDGLIEDREDRVKQIMQETKVTKATAERYDDAFQEWFNDSDEVSKDGQETLQEYLDSAPAYTGKIYRGLHLTGSEFDSFMNDASSGTEIKMNGLSSWSSKESVAEGFARNDSMWYDSVIIECVANRTGAPVAHLSVPYEEEQEVLCGMNTSWMVLKSEITKKSNGRRIAKIYVSEWGEKAA